jgi:hypothetical protein
MHKAIEGWGGLGGSLDGCLGGLIYTGGRT